MDGTLITFLMSSFNVELVNIIFKKKVANVSSSVLQNVIVYLKHDN